jgi:hypothetical protein
MEVKRKVIEWIKRYAPAEVLSLILTVIAAGLTFTYTDSYVAAALAGTWGGNIGFFGYILLADIFHDIKNCRAAGIPFTSKNIFMIIRSLLVEFGLAEIADSFFIRPFLMYYLPILCNDFSIGIILAKISADITFYIPAIFFYESNKRYWGKSDPNKKTPPEL